MENDCTRVSYVGFWIALCEVLPPNAVVRPGGQVAGLEESRAVSFPFVSLNTVSQISVPCSDFSAERGPGRETDRNGVTMCGRENGVEVSSGKLIVRPEAGRVLLFHGPIADLVGAHLTGEWKSDACTTRTRRR